MLVPRGGRVVPVRLTLVEPSPSVVHQQTKIVAQDQKSNSSLKTRVSEPLSVCGLERQLKKINRVMQWCFSENAQLSKNAPRGILLHGPPGSGKTHLARAAAEQAKIKVISCSGGSGERGYIGAAADLVRETGRKALAEHPCVLVLDEVDGLLTGESGATEGGAAVLMGLLDKIHAQSLPVLVVAICNKIRRLPVSLRRAGRLEVEIEVGQLDRLQRLAILESLVGKEAVPPSLALPGMVAGDVAALAREARLLAKMDKRDIVTQDDVLQSVKRVQAGAGRGWEVDVPLVGLDDVGGMHEVKQRLIECIEWPIQHAEAFARLGIKPSSGILLYGPPGNGKTLIARAVASRFSCSFIVVKGPELFSKYVGESERALAKVFVQARQQHPCVIFLDEIDALAPRRSGGGQVTDRMLSTLLSQLDGVSPLKGVTVIAATNRPDHLDPALLRPGRLSHLLYVSLPNATARESIFQGLISKVPSSMSKTEISLFAREECEGFSGAECAAIVRAAKLIALSRPDDPPSLTMDDLQKAKSQNPKRTSPESLAFYENWTP